MLTTIDLIKLLKNVKSFRGVFPCDRLPKHFKKPASLIINLDESYKEGSHWVAIYFDTNRRAHYFDSFGRKPSGNILTFIEQNSEAYHYNHFKYQGNYSVACGDFCLLFVILSHDLSLFYSIFKKCKHIANEKTLMFILNKIF